MEKLYFVYKYTFPNNKVYIGKSNTLNKRFGKLSNYKYQVVYRAMKKYPDFLKEIIAYFETEQEAFDFEIKCIELYQSTNPQYGYNQTKGGDGCSSVKNMKPVIQYSLKGEIIQEFSSINEAAKKLGIECSTITTACKEKYSNKTAGGYQ